MTRPISAKSATSIGLIAALAIVVVDLGHPQGVAAAMPYIALPLLGLLARAPRVVIGLAALGTLLTVAGAAFSGAGASLYVVLLNRGLAAVLIWVVASVALRHLAIGDRLRHSLETQASCDPLTGLYNRRHMFSLVSDQLSRFKRYGERFALILIDADHFKRINDTYGHVAGDAALRHIAEVCTAAVRDIDTVGRFGGEEFIILLPHTGIGAARNVAERIRRGIDASGFDWEGRRIEITLSLGVAEVGSGAETFDELLKAADRALYAAKRGGRNRVATAVASRIADPQKAA